MDEIVTVVVPTYNRAHLLHITIPSYLQLGVKELILVDDCSSDNTPEAVKSLQRIYPKITYFRQEKNKRQPEANNKGLANVKTEWVYFGDDDSILSPGTIPTLLATAQKYNADIVGAKALYMASGEENMNTDKIIAIHESVASCPKEIVDIAAMKANFSLSFPNPIEVPFCHACLLCNANIAKKVRFDPLYTGNAYREETDFIINCAKEGAKIYYDSQGCQINLPGNLATGGARGKSRRKYKLDMIRNNWRFLKKNWQFIQDKYNIRKGKYLMQLEFISGFILRPLYRLIKGQPIRT